MSEEVIGSKATVYVISIVILCVLTVSFILLLTLLRPGDPDNASLVTTVIGFIVPINMALLAGAVQQVHLAVNSRLTSLLELTAKSSRAEGKLEQKGS